VSASTSTRRNEVEETVTDPAQPRPVPGPPRAVPAPTAAPTAAAATTPAPPTSGSSPFAGLAERPVADHVAVYEAEHERLQRELSTIDQL
jgi:hypothetical protein